MSKASKKKSGKRRGRPPGSKNKPKNQNNRAAAGVTETPRADVGFSVVEGKTCIDTTVYEQMKANEVVLAERVKALEFQAAGHSADVRSLRSVIASLEQRNNDLRTKADEVIQATEDVASSNEQNVQAFEFRRRQLGRALVRERFELVARLCALDQKSEVFGLPDLGLKGNASIFEAIGLESAQS